MNQFTQIILGDKYNDEEIHGQDLDKPKIILAWERYKVFLYKDSSKGTELKNIFYKCFPCILKSVKCPNFNRSKYVFFILGKPFLVKKGAVV